MPTEDVGEPRYRTLLLTLGLLTTITAIVSSLGAPLIPAIADEHNVTLTEAQWALTATLLTAAVATPIIGRLGAGQMRRPTIITGLVVVTLGSMLAALPWGFAPLLIGRAMQGVGLALVPLAMAVARDVIRPPRISTVIAMLSVTAVAGTGLGYPLTAVVAQSWGLAAAYWMGAVLSACTLLMALSFVPRAQSVIRAPVDWAGAVMLSAGTGCTLLAVSRGETWGWTSVPTVVLALVGPTFLVVWGRWSLRRDHPLVDLRLATRSGIAAPNLVAFGGGIGMYTLLTLTIVLVQSSDPVWGLDHSVTVGGLMLVPYSLMSVVGSRLALAAGAEYGPNVLLPLGSVVFMGSTLGLALLHSNVYWALGWMAVGGLGSGFTFSSLAVLIVPHVPQEETGSAMAFNMVLRYLGFSVGSAVSVTLMAVYGGGQQGFVWTLVTMAAVFGVVAVGAWLLTTRQRPPAVPG